MNGSSTAKMNCNSQIVCYKTQPIVVTLLVLYYLESI